MNFYKRQTSLSDLEIFLKTSIERNEGNDISDAVREKEEQSPSYQTQIYGRICTTKNPETPPVNLSDVPGRKTAFLFGPDTVFGALIRHIHDPYAMLLKLGFLPEYIHMKACKQKACYWLVLLSADPSGTSSDAHPSSPFVKPVPATWEGLLTFLGKCYPDALLAVRAHWSLITSKPVEYFEEKSPVKFIQALSDPTGPDFMTYSKFLSLPKPQKDWETRLFLYCELRILELFSGDGHTWSEAGVRGEKEFMSPNYSFESDLGKENYIILPLKVVVPPDIREKYD
ncbi:uncharacterized protein [Diadema antillarum]|uniref:uncharacterized protein n=1 Tax=Diadema antillarum TaxID=105358 RepID=UPI003A8ABC24